ncbi:WhiB family transcriptional regulator [Rhodococcus sp. JS3073]|uniref:WhiB family transcriptional regulator n=1 Tax=Rhodococcus sp. JS3073 TaxID=3002901 RepID=UPI002E20DF31
MTAVPPPPPAGSGSPPRKAHRPSHPTGWPMRARCRGTDTSTFFSPTGESRKARDRRETAAKTLCAQCPVMRPCRDYALAAGEAYGVWGGMTERERRRAAARRPTRCSQQK